MNKAISWRSDKHFTGCGAEYQCTNAYVRYETPMLDVVDNSGELIAVDINDKDFIFNHNSK
uniref:hypothetical protein n=1 Tax=Clostridium sp. 12(A) TaxID=1163671 RepID=UPI0004657E3C|nr:hypothetical protein [Clostridium sp. 12(A)]